MIRTLKNFVHLCIAGIANCLYLFPSRSMKVIGITGTDGKTTTATLVYDILTANGYSVALLTTVSAVINGKSYDTGFHVTTPNAFALQKYFALAKKAGVEYFILETTSHGLDQNRVFGTHFAVSAITNIASEHLDYHRTYEQYLQAKSKIIAMSDCVVLNKDDKSYTPLVKIREVNNKKTKLISFGLGDNADINSKKYPLKTTMPGEFNLYNALAALSICMQLGIEYDLAKDVIESYKTPIGRQEVLTTTPFTVMVDFAHTPHSFHALLSSLRSEYTGSIIHVFGSAGDRDHDKRPEMGKISSQFADQIIITAEDPRHESVKKITADILTGVSKEFTLSDVENTDTVKKNAKRVYTIADRKEAIEFAVSLAKKGDIIVVTGKGHEQSMNFGNGEQPWSDHAAVKEALQDIHV